MGRCNRKTQSALRFTRLRPPTSKIDKITSMKNSPQRRRTPRPYLLSHLQHRQPSDAAFTAHTTKCSTYLILDTAIVLRSGRPPIQCQHTAVAGIPSKHYVLLAFDDVQRARTVVRQCLAYLLEQCLLAKAECIRAGSRFLHRQFN